MKKPALLLGLTLLSIGCLGRKPATSLHQAAGSAWFRSPCDKVVGGSWPYAFPIPSNAPGGRKFKLFFYMIEGNPGSQPKVYSPGAEAELDADTGIPTYCSPWPTPAVYLPGRRWPEATKGMGVWKLEKAHAKLFDRTEMVGEIYAAKRPSNSKDAAAAKDFLDLFEKCAEPLLLPYYYDLNPDFWEWLRTAAGRSIPKPAR